jgi:ketosteroid isomerase-like protein
VLAALSLCVAVCLAQTQARSTRADIGELLSKHDEAMNQHNLDGVVAMYAPGPKTLMLGTGPGEKFQGPAEIKAAYAEMFKDYDKGTLKHTCYWKDGRGSGNVVWGGAMCKLSDSKGGKNREYELNVSVVAEKQGEKWLFVLIHYSNLVGSGTPTTTE